MSTPTPNAPVISTAINEDDKGASVTLASSLGLGFSLFFLLFRFFIRWPLRDFLKVDDAAITVATIFAIGQVIAITVAVNYGLGERSFQLQESELRSIYKAIFASDILFIASLGIAKLAFAFLIYRLSSKTRHRRAAQICFGTIVVWTLLSIILMSIPCHGRFPWNNLDATCSFMTSKSIVITSLDVVTEVSLLALPTYFLWKIQIKRSTRIFALSMFWVRMCIPAFSICRLHQILRHQSSDDYIFEAVHPAIMTQVLMHAALIFATIPSISPILKTFNTGFLVPDAGHIENTRYGTNVDRPTDDSSGGTGATFINMRSIISLLGRHSHFSRAKSTWTSDTPTSPSATLTSATNNRSGTTELPLTRSRSPLLPLDFKIQGENNEGRNRNSTSLTLGALQPSHYEHETIIESRHVRRRQDADGTMRLPSGGRKGRKGSPSGCCDTANAGVDDDRKRSSSCYDDGGDNIKNGLDDGNILSVHAGNEQMFIHRTVDVSFYDKETKGNAHG